MEGMHVPIIEDDKDTAGFFSTVLQLVGYECEIVLSARDALARLAGSVPDLILLDMRLGLEVAASISSTSCAPTRASTTHASSSSPPTPTWPSRSPI